MGRAVACEPRGAPAELTVVAGGAGRPWASGPVLEFAEARLDGLGEHEVAGDHGEQDEEEREWERREAKHLRQRSERRIAPTVAHAIGRAIIVWLGRLRKKGTRRVRMTKTTRVWVASDSTNHPVRNSLWPASGRRASRGRS